MLESHRSKLGQTKTLNQFNLDADEMEGWLNEKLKSLQDDSYQDPAFVQVNYSYVVNNNNTYNCYFMTVRNLN